MKLSIEAKVAAAVAGAFIALTAAAIGQSGSDAQGAASNNYGPTGSAVASTRFSAQAYNSSVLDRANVDCSNAVLKHF